MTYTKIDKGNGERKTITRKEALSIISKNYDNPKYVLQEAERIFGNTINTPFCLIEVKK